MKIAILHLSDFHLKKNDIIKKEKIEKIIDAMKVAGKIDEYIIVFSGDLTNSGQVDEYRNTRFVFKKLIEEVKSIPYERYVHILAVPGNHDIELSSDRRDEDYIQQLYEDKKTEEILGIEFNSQKNYFTETNVTNREWPDKLINYKYVKFGDYIIQFNLINSAPFSSLKPDDKGCHYFSPNKLHLLRKKDDASICITVMHHNIEWFRWENKIDLQKAIYDNSEFLFLGHDHVGFGKREQINSDTGIWISASGSMSLAKIDKSDSFNLIVIDTESTTFTGYLFNWNYQHMLYIHENIVNEQPIYNKSASLAPNVSYIKLIKEDPRNNLSYDFSDYYVFPKLHAQAGTDFSSKITIKDFNDFNKCLDKREICYVEGGSNSGKTMLLRYLYIEFCKDSLPLFWDASSFNGTMKNTFRSLFNDQYGESNALFEKYIQSAKRKILIIDNWDHLKENKKETILSYVSEVVDLVIISQLPNLNINIISDFEEKILLKKAQPLIMSISPFHYKKREELVRKVILADNSLSLNEEEIVKVNNAITSLVNHSAGVFMLRPDFIIQYTRFFAKENYHNYNRGEAAFNKIFEHNINESIISNTKEVDVSEVITVLEEIAYHMHKSRIDRLAIIKIYEIIDQYNQEYSNNVKHRKFIDSVTRAKILCEFGSNDEITFTNRSYFAYFIARYLNRAFQSEGQFEDILRCITNICIDVNSDVILFLTYLTSNTRVITEISNMAEKLLRDWTALSFEDNNLPLLTSPVELKSAEIKAPTQDDREKYRDAQEKSEEEKPVPSDDGINGIFDNDQSKLSHPIYKIIKAYTYTEMIAKALPAFHSIIKGKTKQFLVDCLYLYPAKIVYEYLTPIDQNFDEICSALVKLSEQLYNENKIEKVYSANEIKYSLQWQAILTFLSIFDNLAAYAVDEKTQGLLCDTNSSKRVNIIMRLLFTENTGNTDKLLKEIQRLQKDEDNPLLSIIYRLIMRKHLMTNPHISFAVRQKINDRIFGGQLQKEITSPISRLAK